MPTYQYACTECADRVEVVQSFTDEPLTVCSSCGGRLRKVFSPVGIVFKGSGFYRTDSRKNADQTRPAAKPESGEKTAVSESGSPDKKSSDTSSKTPAPASSSSPASSSGTGSSPSSSSSPSTSGSKVA